MVRHQVVATGATVRFRASYILGKVEKKDRDFESFFGVTEEQCAVTYNLCTWPDGITLDHLLWGLLFLKVYATTSVLMRLAGAGSRATFRKKVWIVLGVLRAQSESLVSFHLPDDDSLLMLL